MKKRKSEVHDNDLNVDEKNNHYMAKLVEKYEEDMLAKKLERMSRIVDRVSSWLSKCQEYNNVKEVLAHKESCIENKDKIIKSKDTRQKKEDE